MWHFQCVAIKRVAEICSSNKINKNRQRRAAVLIILVFPRSTHNCKIVCFDWYTYIINTIQFPPRRVLKTGGQVYHYLKVQSPFYIFGTLGELNGLNWSPYFKMWLTSEPFYSPFILVKRTPRSAFSYLSRVRSPLLRWTTTPTHLLLCHQRTANSKRDKETQLSAHYY